MIINFLVKALCDKESVFVNNLGLFRKEYEPAHIGDNMITPPGYKVVFDPDFDGNGFAFTMFVSQKGSMLITDATTEIDQWVSQLKTALDNNKSVSFENFGTFAKDENGTITYVCERIAELNVDYEGLEAVPLHPNVSGDDTDQDDLPKEDKGMLIQEEQQPDELFSEKNEAENQEAEEMSPKEKQQEEILDVTQEEEHSDVKDGQNEDEQQTANGKKKSHAWLIVLIILLILAVLAAAYYFREKLTDLYLQYFDQHTEIVAEDPIPSEIIPITDTIDSLNYIDSLAIASDSSSDAAIKESAEESLSTIEIEPQKKQTISQLPGGENFFINYEKGKNYVIVGSFRSEKEVRQHIKERKLEQYNPKVVMQSSSKQMRICIGVFDTETAADNYGRETGLNYWILK